MRHSSRREFLQRSGLLLAVAIGASSFDWKKKKPLLSFSTLGCPDWSFQQITDFAVQHRYAGIELRGIQRQLDLPRCPEFSNAQNRKTALRMMEDKGLVFVNLGSSATLHFPAGAERNKNLDDGKRFIDLAQDIRCPYVRVFPNNFPKDQDKQFTIDLIADGLRILGNYAAGSDVNVLLETHGDLLKTADLENVMQKADHKNTGLVWDFCNMWSVTRESPVLMYQTLKKYIRHTHIKDAKLLDGKPSYVFLGRGEVPVAEAIELLVTGGYKGYYSFEWEKMWHPELAEPELALADYPVAMKKYFKK